MAEDIGRLAAGSAAAGPQHAGDDRIGKVGKTNDRQAPVLAAGAKIVCGHRLRWENLPILRRSAPIRRDPPS
ncbi:MAG: hypothetical protein M0Q42_13030 [Xanthomonadales bacterium]|nr:hypothetical protein [Xanthomonadales bacterium]